MTTQTTSRENETPRDAPNPGQIEHYIREDIEDLMLFYGFERARQVVAEILMEVAGGNRPCF